MNTSTWSTRDFLSRLPSNTRNRRPWLGAALLLLWSAFGQAQLHAASAKTTQEWPTATPAEAEIDPAPLERLLEDLSQERKHGLHSLLIVRRGQLVLEEYWDGHGRDKTHDLRSTTKSITSLLVGIAIDKGIVGGVDDPLMSYLAGAYPEIDGAEAKGKITLEHLLTMASGLDCHDRDRKTKGQEDRMYRQRDWVRYFLDLSVVRDPGTESFYCTGGVVALGRVIAEASGQSVPEFARQHLFGPLGVEGERWSLFDRDRQTDTGGHLYLRPRDMAKLGQLILQQGRWNDVQLVPSAWIERSTSEQTRIDEGKPYGYLWWMAAFEHGSRKIKMIFTSGNGGQHIFIIPDLETVVVTTAGNYNSAKAGLPFSLLGRYIVPSILGDG